MSIIPIVAKVMKRTPQPRKPAVALDMSSDGLKMIDDKPSRYAQKMPQRQYNQQTPLPIYIKRR